MIRWIQWSIEITPAQPGWTIADPGVTGIDPQIVTDMVEKRAWLPLGALAVGLGVRLLKSDIKYFPTLSPNQRRIACLVLGQVAGTIEAVVAGKTYKEAIVWGVTQSILALVGHNLFIEGVRNGKEIPIPGLTKSSPLEKPKSTEAISISVPVDIAEDVKKDKIPTESGKE